MQTNLQDLQKTINKQLRYADRRKFKLHQRHAKGLHVQFAVNCPTCRVERAHSRYKKVA